MVGLQFACHHYLVLLSALGDIIDVGEHIFSALSRQTFITVDFQRGDRGRPRIAVSAETLENLVEMGLPTSCITKLLGVSRATLFRWMSKNNISVSATYSKCSDEELDALITAIKRTMPDAGLQGRPRCSSCTRTQGAVGPTICIHALCGQWWCACHISEYLS